MNSDKPRETRKLAMVIAANVLVTILLVEVASVGVYFAKTREWYYVRDRSRVEMNRASLETQPLQTSADNLSLIYRLHPYFGFVYRQGFVQAGVTTNNYGFLSQVDFPYKAKPNQFVVGILGGSVAALFSFYEHERHMLAEALRQLPPLRDKEIVVLSFAGGAYKQPQQLIVLNYFLSIGQKLDLAINIDGFNEVAFSFLDNRASVDVSMPSMMLITPLIDLADKGVYSDDLALTLRALEGKQALGGALKALEGCTFATCYVMRWIRFQYLSRRYTADLEALNSVTGHSATNSLFSVKRNPQPLNDDLAAERVADEWASASQLMNTLLAARAVPYLHLLQPNQYFQTARRFTDAEKRIAFTENAPARPAVAAGYPKLLARLGGLRAAGVHVVDGTRLLDQIPDAAYADNCCHYSNEGNAAIARSLAANVRDLIGSKTISR